MTGTPTWAWTDGRPHPSTIRVEPAFKAELGDVFVGVGKWDAQAEAWAPDSPEQRSHHGIWLSAEQVTQLRQALDAIDAYNASHEEGGPTDTGNEITLRAVEYGHRKIQIDRAEYESAKADDMLDHLLDAWLSDVESETVIYEPDGTAVRPY
jgi:hypothetical protein